MSSLISVIIVNFNAGLELTSCVQSIIGTQKDLEIVIVDNNSRDNSIQHLLDQCYGVKNVSVVQNDKNPGFAVACNQGSRAANGKVLLYLNPDCIVEPETIPVLLDELEKGSDIGMVGGLILNHDGSEQRGCRRTIPTPWKSLVNSFGLKYLNGLNTKLFSDFRLDREPLPDQAMEVEAISGACMLVRKEAYTDVGPMDEEYFLHCEDLDWCMRFRQRGWRIMFVPQARLLHSKGSCSSSRPVFVEWSKHNGMVRFYRKFFADQYPRSLFCLVWLGIWVRFGLSVAIIYMQKLFRMKKNDS